MGTNATWRAARFLASWGLCLACGSGGAPETPGGQSASPAGGAGATSGVSATTGGAGNGGAAPSRSGESASQPSTEFPTGVEGPGADLPAVCHELADAVCTRKAQCGALNNDHGREYGECRWYMLTSCASNWNLPAAAFDEPGLTQCIADLDGYDCFALLHLYGIGVPTSVQDCNPPGEQLDGEPCSLRFQCRGEVCALDDATGCQQCLTLDDDNAEAWALSGADYGRVENAGDPPSHDDCTNRWLDLVDGLCQPTGGLDVSPRDEPEPEPEPVADRSLAGRSCSFESDCGPRGTCDGSRVNELTGMQTPGVCELTLALGESCTQGATHMGCEGAAECIDDLCQLPVIAMREYEPLPETCEPAP